MRALNWPRSLLARNAALIVALVLGGQLITIMGHLFIVQVPRANQLAELTGRYLTVLERALASAEAAERNLVITETGKGPFRIERVGPPPMTTSNWLSRIFVGRMEGLLPGRRIVMTPAPDEALWLEASAGGQTFWVVTEAKGIVASNFNTWLVISLAGIFIGLGGALAINRKINQPLAELEQAARRVGAGIAGPRLPEHGPAELASVAAAFNRMVRDLDRMDKDRALMLAGISHDLRTPLTRARLAVELLDGTSDAELIKRIVDSIDKVDRTLGQFLAFARDETTETPVYTDINSMVTEIIESEGRAGVSINHARGELPEIMVRPLALDRAIANLVENALNHGKPPISVATMFDGDTITIIIRDYGFGIAPSDVSRLLQPFQQMRPDMGRSAGLGLAIVDRIARLHSGDLSFGHAPDGAFEARLRIAAGG